MTRVPNTVRQFVRIRANKQCEYCHRPDVYSVVSFHVDHIIPTKQHDGSSDEENLAWSCVHCNISKSVNIAGYDPLTKQLTPLFNPRTQQWDEHFQLNEATIEGMTPVGCVTVKILNMNEQEMVAARQSLIDKGLM
jgi:5-methylcytosine-specific restriction endonuclease McrA